ncbi:MAG: hypothetical protein FWG87_14815 [Defluviitaleaceae bacterium]|nr:hypothetical protein [Defluviitaleaceae bacterium]
MFWISKKECCPSHDKRTNGKACSFFFKKCLNADLADSRRFTRIFPRANPRKSVKIR